MFLNWILLLAPLTTFVSTAIIIRVQRFFSDQVSAQYACFLAGLINGSGILIVALSLELNRGNHDTIAMASLVLYVSVYMFCVNFLNWFVYALTETSMHIHLVALLARYESLSQDELYSLYNKNTIIRVRIPRLLQWGQLKRKDERLVLSGSWVLVGAIGCRILRRILGIPTRPELVKRES
jgi:hypothetical protein